MIRRPPRSTQSRSSAASDVYKRQVKALDKRLLDVGEPLAAHPLAHREYGGLRPVKDFLGPVGSVVSEVRDLVADVDKVPPEGHVAHYLGVVFDVVRVGDGVHEHVDVSPVAHRLENAAVLEPVSY